MRQQDSGILFWFSGFFVDSCNVFENAVRPSVQTAFFRVRPQRRTAFGADGIFKYITTVHKKIREPK